VLGVGNMLHKLCTNIVLIFFFKFIYLFFIPALMALPSTPHL